MGLQALDALPSRGAFATATTEPTSFASLKPYVSTSSSSVERATRVTTDGTNILIRQLSQSRARAEAKKRAARALAAAEAKQRSADIAAEAKKREADALAALEAAKAKAKAKNASTEDAGASARDARATPGKTKDNPFARKRSGGSSGDGERTGTSAKRGKITDAK